MAASHSANLRLVSITELKPYILKPKGLRLYVRHNESCKYLYLTNVSKCGEKIYRAQNKTARIFLCKPLFYLAGVAGLEPATIGFGDRCSTNWNYTPVDVGHYAKSTSKGKVLFMAKLIN